MLYIYILIKMCGFICLNTIYENKSVAREVFEHLPKTIQ